MTISEFETRGFYEPGLLHLRINTDKSLDNLNELMDSDRELFSTFLHEYLHFLQEVTTTNGLTHTAFYINTLKALNYNVINDGKEEFEVPFVIDNNFNTLSQIEVRFTCIGDVPNENYAKYDGYIQDMQKIDDHGTIINVPKYKVYFYDQDRQLKNFYFGSTCLKEFVAHCIQSQFYPDVDHPDLPYKIAELILDKECPTLASNLQYYLALCDACLIGYHPAQLFFEAIERIKAENYTPKTPEDIYEYVLNVKFGRNSAQFTPLQLFQAQKKDVIDHLENALQIAEFSTNLDWIKHILSEASDLRFNNPTFMTKIIDQNGNLTETFHKITKALGTPYFTNNKELGGMIMPENLAEPPKQPYQLLAFKQILNIYNGKQNCSLYNLCSHSKSKVTVDENCKVSPWKRAKDQQLCPLAQLWRTWGLTDQIPVKRSR